MYYIYIYIYTLLEVLRGMSTVSVAVLCAEGCRVYMNIYIYMYIYIYIYTCLHMYIYI